MKEKLNSFTLYFLIAIFGLGWIMLEAGSKNDNTIIIKIGVALMVIVALIALLIYSLTRSKHRKLEIDYQENLNKFKKRARRIKVNLEDVEILSNNWTDDVILRDSQYGGLDQLSGNPESNILKVNRKLNSVKIVIPINGKNLEYIFNIEMDPKTLNMHFAIKKETLLYIADDELYLDLDFLD